jgi:copper chaperone CopZ
MKSISKILMAASMLLSFQSFSAQLDNSKTSTVKIYGNCGMCESAIEKAGNVKKVTTVEWNKDSKMATLTYDSVKTNQDEILRRIALAGYDSEHFFAPDEAYAKLPACCHYDRAKVPGDKDDAMASLKADKPATEMHDHSAVTLQDKNQLKAVYEGYFSLKDALVKSDGSVASAKAKDLLAALSAVKMETLKPEEHTVWMKVKEDLTTDAEHITETKEVSHQRDHFTTLSKNMYQLIKVSKNDAPVYYQHCPMYNDGKGADWLSKESAIKNPYYGSQMLSCGKTVETIN